MFSQENVVALQTNLLALTTLPNEALFTIKNLVFDILQHPCYQNVFYDSFYASLDQQGVSTKKEFFPDRPIFLKLFSTSNENSIEHLTIWQNRIAAWENKLEQGKKTSTYSRRVETELNENLNDIRLCVSLFHLLHAHQSLIFILPEFNSALAACLASIQSYLNKTISETELAKSILDLQVRSEIYTLYLSDFRLHLSTLLKLATPKKLLGEPSGLAPFPFLQNYFETEENLSSESDDSSLSDVESAANPEPATPLLYKPSVNKVDVTHSLQAIAQQIGQVSVTTALMNTSFEAPKHTLMQAILMWLFPKKFQKWQAPSKDWLRSLVDYFKGFDILQTSMHPDQQPLDEQVYEFFRRITNDLRRLNFVPNYHSNVFEELITEAQRISDTREAKLLANELIGIINEHHSIRAATSLRTYLENLEVNTTLFQNLITLVFLHLDKFIFGDHAEVAQGDEKDSYTSLMMEYWDSWFYVSKHDTRFYQQYYLNNLTLTLTQDTHDYSLNSY